MKNNAIINLALIVIIGGYLFFFTSNLWIPHNASAKKQTPLNESVEWADRAITIERWDYCEQGGLMEVYMDIKSNTYDGIYAYKYEAVDRSEDNLKVSAAVEEPECSAGGSRYREFRQCDQALQGQQGSDTGKKRSSAGICSE